MTLNERRLHKDRRREIFKTLTCSNSIYPLNLNWVITKVKLFSELQNLMRDNNSILLKKKVLRKKKTKESTLRVKNIFIFLLIFGHVAFWVQFSQQIFKVEKKYSNLIKIVYLGATNGRWDLLLSIFHRAKLGFFMGYPPDVITLLGSVKGLFRPLGCVFEKGYGVWYCDVCWICLNCIEYWVRVGRAENETYR